MCESLVPGFYFLIFLWYPTKRRIPILLDLGLSDSSDDFHTRDTGLLKVFCVYELFLSTYPSSLEFYYNLSSYAETYRDFSLED
jgi:hypothetical protein